MIKRMDCKKQQSQPQVVLDDAYYSNPELIDVYIANISDKKLTSRIIKKLQDLYPLGSLQHLKRVRSQSNNGPLQVIIHKENCNTKLKGEDVLDDGIANIEGLGNPYLVKVPAIPPLTRKQYEESIKFWPVNFHEDKEIVRLLSGSYFTDAQLEIMQGYMTEAIKMAKLGAKKEEVPIGVLVVDPETNSLIAKSIDLRKNCHPLKHAVMVAIDLVACSQGGGMWNHTDQDLFYRQPSEGSKVEDKTGPYLLTGYDLYVTQEPCVMCSMALVHSRVKQVFYGSSLVSGALDSHYKIHCQTGLNHHYRVFKDLMKLETDKLYTEGR